jgi:anti-sigma regulatory factor (Ser/Thr protein kinase)
MYSNYYIYIKHWSQGLLVKTMLLLVLPTAGMLLGEWYGIEGMWLGIGGAFVAAYGINLAVVKLRHHGRNLLLMDKARTNRQLSYDINSVMDEVMALSVKVAQDLQKLGVSAAKIIRLRLLVEEIGMHAVERAEGNVFQLEISFLLSSDPAEAIIMSVRDNAPPYDIIAVVQQGEFSWREHFIESITADLPKRRYLSAGDENRFMLEID